MGKALGFLQKHSKGKTVLILFLSTMVVYLAMLLYTIPVIISQAPHLKILDMSPTGYSAEDVNLLFSAIGAKGREFYLNVQLPIDFIYPGLFAITNSLMLGWLFGLGFKSDSSVFYLMVVPFLAGGFDYLENLGVIMMLSSFPDISEPLVNISSMFTVLKSGFTIVFYLILIGGLIPIVNRKLKGL